ncbi:twin-arginine translocation signal domain-containing protein [Jhaorihella thermophila]
MSAAKRINSPIDRRRFLKDSARGLAGCAVAGMGLAWLISDARALPAEALRPPGGPARGRLSGCLHPLRSVRAGLSL